MKSLLTSLVAALFAFATATAFAEMDIISSPWWDSEHVQVNPSADDDKPAPAPAPDPDKDKS